MTIIERARRYVGAMPAGVSGQGRHNATVAVANVLLHGFALSESDAWALLQEYNERCQPPSDERKLMHRFEVAKAFDNANKAPGWLRSGRDGEMGSVGEVKRKRVWRPAPKPVYDGARLARFAGEWAGTVDLVWLANRSAVDPALVSREDFLELLYRTGDRVLCFTEVNGQGNPWTQGEAIWPEDSGAALPGTGKCGVWYLAQPVDGEWHVNPRQGKTSRRSEESVIRWPFLVLESDEAPLREWLGALVRLPLRIVAIYSSGGRSVHALVRIDAATKGHWDEVVKRRLAPGLKFLVLNGADPGVFSAVRLTRLPGAYREGKMSGGRYVRFARRSLQKLLYVNPEALARPICELPAVRDVVGEWCDRAAGGVADADESGGEWIREGLGYYARVSDRCRVALGEMDAANEC